LVEAEVTLANARTFGVRTGFWVEVALSCIGVALVGAARLGGRRRVGTMAS
jgi:apolipoprotein N-acyltransferase